jgi:hypothetical protein
MALSAPRVRPWSPSRVPVCLLLIGLAGVVAVGGSYIAVAKPVRSSLQFTLEMMECPR